MSLNQNTFLQPLYPYGEPVLSGLIKQQAEDFKVSENLGFEPTGSGEHLFLFIEKTNQTTLEVIEQLSTVYEIKSRDIGYCGLKDKQAITRQWFSLYLPGQMNQIQLQELAGCQTLESSWHDKKLRPGSHQSNDFEVVIRQLSGDDSKFNEQINQIESHGFAHYFGEQRFGSQQDNVEKGLRILSSPHKSKRLTRSRKSIYISALRSFLFNRILRERISQDSWLKPAQGDVFMLRGSHSIFSEAINEDILERYQTGDISSTASLYGAGDSKLQGLALEIEQDILQKESAIVDCLLTQKSKLQMRSCREFCDHLEINHDPEKAELQIKARLARGTYFTTFLSHFLNFR